eukprot:143288_1
MAHRQKHKKRKQKKKCKKNKVRNNPKAIKTMKCGKPRKSEKQQAVIHPQRLAQEEEKENINEFTWRVTGDLLRQFKNAKKNQSFHSGQFKTIDGSSWRILAYPHGDIPGCNFGVECVQLRANKQPLGVNWWVNIMEVDWYQISGGDTVKCDGETVRPRRFYRKIRLDYDFTLTIKCVIEETMDVREENTDFEWKITNNWLRRWKNPKYNDNKRSFESPIFQAIGQEWFIAISLPGSLYLSMLGRSIKELDVCYYVGFGIDHDASCQIDFNGDTVNKENGYCIFLCTSPFQLGNDSEFTICVKIWEKGSIDRNEGRLISNIYSDKMRKIQHPSAETNRHLRHENERLKSKVQKTTIDHAKALESLDSFTKSLQAENARLRQEHLEIQKENEQLKTTAQKARMDHMNAMTEITRLRTENSELNEECKETKLELIRVKKENQQLKATMNTSNYVEWTHSELVHWIISIDDGAYAQYEHGLRLLFAKENVNGAVISLISKSDLKDWGIHDFAHRSKIYKQIQKLINQQNKAIQDIEGQGNTAYI